MTNTTMTDIELFRPSAVERLASIEAKIDMLLKGSGDHEKRLRGLEYEKWLHRGGLGILSLIAYKIGLPWVNIG